MNADELLNQQRHILDECGKTKDIKAQLAKLNEFLAMGDAYLSDRVQGLRSVPGQGERRPSGSEHEL